jgi:hypothetical protein
MESSATVCFEGSTGECVSGCGGLVGRVLRDLEEARLLSRGDVVELRQRVARIRELGAEFAEVGLSEQIDAA